MTNLFYYKYDSETGELSRYNITDINENIYDSQNRTKITVSINGKDMVTYFDKRLIDHYKNDRVISYNDIRPGIILFNNIPDAKGYLGNWNNPAVAVVPFSGSSTTNGYWYDSANSTIYSKHPIPYLQSRCRAPEVQQSANPRKAHLQG